MSFEHVPVWTWALLAALLALSGCFSAIETALFSLQPQDRARAGGAARALLDEPSELLVTVLLANLLVNVSFFAFAGRLVASDAGHEAELAIGVGALLAVLGFAWPSLFPGTTTWTPEKAEQWAEVKDRLAVLGLEVRA